MHRFLPLLALAGLLLAGLSSPAQAQSCTTNWTSPSGGNWSNAANWSAGVPGASDDACIILPGAYTVTLDVSPTVNSLTLGQTAGAGRQTLLNTSRVLTLTNPGTVRARGVYDWQGGQLTGTLVNGGLVALSGSSFKDLRNGTLDNRALVTMGGNSGPRFISEAAILNAAGATFDVQSDADIVSGGGTGTRTFVNNGLVRKSGGTAGSSLSVFGVTFVNNALVRAEVGTIEFDGPSLHTDAVLDASAGAAVQFDNGTHTVVGTLSGSPAGAVFVDSGATLTGGQLDFGGTGFEWRGGDGLAEITNVGLLRLTTSSFKDIRDATVTNEGLTELVGTAGLRFIFEATFVNAPGGVFDFQSDADIVSGGGTGDKAFVNNGLVRKSAGTGSSVLSVFGVTFENNTLVRAEVGTIEFSGVSTHTNAMLDAAAGAAVRFASGTHTVVGTLSGEPAGAVFTDSGTLTGDALDFSGTGFEWRGGDGLAEITNVGLLRLTTSSFKDIRDATVTNEGLTELVGTAGLRFIFEATFVNAPGGVFDFQSDADIVSGGGTGDKAFVNNGLVRKSAGTGSSVLSVFGVTFENDAGGVVSVESGEFDVNGPFDHAAGARIQGTGIFDKINATFTHDGDTAPGTSPGILTWQNDWVPNASSTLLIEIGGDTPGDDYDQLAVQGDAALGGTLRLSSSVGSPPEVGDTFTILTADGDVTGTFDTVELPFGYAVNVAYNAEDVVVTVTQVPDFDLVATNTTSLTVTPGGSVTFSYSITNNTALPIDGEFWFLATPSNTAGIIRQGTLPGMTTITGTYTQLIPPTAPPGTYSYRLRIGGFPSSVVDEEVFTLVIEPAARLAAEAGPVAWTVSEVAPWRTADGRVIPSELGDAALTDAGSATQADAAASREALPAAFGLAPAYPNPARDQAALALALPEAGPVAVAVYDALGRRVAVLAEGEREAGTHRLVLDGSSLPSGTYLVRAVGAGTAVTQRVTLVR